MAESGPSGSVRQDAADPFATAALRQAVLDAWAASPTRFREDANAEDDLVRGGYRDRLVVELAQNAADAAVAAGVPGRLLLRLREGALDVSNTGAPLDAPGVASLAALRASAKRDQIGSVGRFGVGFAAVLAVSDEPELRSTHGGVGFAADATRKLAAGLPGLADELLRREGRVPVLRLPFAVDAAPEPGYATTVVLPLRDAAATEDVRRQLDAIDDALLLGLPGLAEVVVETGAHHRRRLTARRDGETLVVHDGERERRWRTTTEVGELDPALLLDRPVEERGRLRWTLTWAVPVDTAGHPVQLPTSVPAVLHAPTPSDEPLALPALLLAGFPLDPARRRVAPGPATDHLAEAAGRCYADLLAALLDDVGPAALTLAPGAAPAGALDGRIREAARSRLARLRLFPTPGAGRRTASQVRAVDLAPPDAVDLLADVVDGLVPASWAAHEAALSSLGVHRAPLPDVLDELASTALPPSWWRQLYASLGGVDAHLLEGLPVPLVDGRVVRGPRLVVLPEAEQPLGDGGTWSLLGARIVHPDAAHPLLARLGAATFDPARQLADPHLLAQLAEADADLVEAVLVSAASTGLAPGQVPGLAQLPLPCEGGGTVPAGECVVPGSPLAAVVADDVPVVARWVVERFGTAALVAVGCLERLRVVDLGEVELDVDLLDREWPDADGWCDDVLELLAGEGADIELPPRALGVRVVRGIDLVADGAWSSAVSLLAEPDVRRALVEAVVVVPVGGPPVRVPSPSAWWLREVPLSEGRCPTQVRLAGSDGVITELYPDVAAVVGDDAELASALGVRSTLDALLAEAHGAEELLDRLSDASLSVSPHALARAYRALSRLPERRWPPPADRLRVAVGAGSRVVARDDVVVVIAPCHLQLGYDAALPGTARLADLLDVASSAGTAALAGTGEQRPVPPEVRALVPTAPATYVEHDDLVVDGCHVEWWVTDAGTAHAATTEGLARALAWAAGAWSRRWSVAALLADSDPAAAAERLAVEEAFEVD